MSWSDILQLLGFANKNNLSMIQAHFQDFPNIIQKVNAENFFLGGGWIIEA